MKKIVIYRAFDGEDFYNEEDCIKYEQKYLNYGQEFVAAYDFYDENWKHLDISIEDMNEMLCNLDFAYQNCVYVKVYFIPPVEAQEFMYGEFGFDLPDEKGVFKYDFKAEFGGGWIRQD